MRCGNTVDTAPLNNATHNCPRTACMRERRGAQRVLIGKPEGKRLLGRLRHRWDNGIKINLKKVGWEVHGLDRAGSG